MKVNNLYTLSQFVELMKLRVYDGMEDYGDFVAKSLGLIYRYTDFLKQPLKKEMFVNELEIPLDMYYIPDYEVQKYPEEYYLPDLEAFKQAEKKVIFKDSFDFVKEDSFVQIYNGDDINLDWEFKKPILRDLAEATNGELELKNIEL